MPTEGETESVWRQRMEASVVFEGAILAEYTQLALVEAPDLQTLEAPRGVDDPHAPG
jgi:hypothetical protein